MSNPFEGMGDDEKEYQKVVSENVNNRMEGAMNDLKKKYANGANRGPDDSAGGPTGDAYKKHQDGMKKKGQAAKNANDMQRQQEAIFVKEQRENMKDNDQVSGEAWVEAFDGAACKVEACKVEA